MLTESNIAELFSSINLSQMDSIRLMNRIDTKYLTDTATLGKILGKASESGYLVLEISGRKIQNYHSMYYDTPVLQMYLDHHNRRLVRQKLRTRYYDTSELTFLELKSKNNHGRTKKKRLEIAMEKYCMTSLDDGCISAWLDEKITYPRTGMSPSLETVFSRITIVNPGKTERSTIDFGISFNNVRKGTCADLGNLAIIEVKQDGNIPSELRDILLEFRVKPLRISKYCIGTAMTDTHVKSCRFKRKLMLINKMKNQI